MINPKLLTAFLEVAEMQNFRAAAERLSRSQSAISMQIRDLEEQLGIALFDRHTRSVTLTPEGECLIEHVRRAVTELDTGLNRIKILRTQHRSRVRVACVPSVAGTRLPQVIARFQKDYPSVQIEVLELLAKRVHEAVRNKVADIGIGPSGSYTDDLHTEILFAEPICAVFPRSMATLTSRSIALKDLQGLPIMTVGKDTVQREDLEDAQTSSGVRLKITHRVAQAQTLLSMVSAGLGVAIVPWIAMEVPGYESLHAYPIVSPPIKREVAVITRKDGLTSSASLRFSLALKETLASAQ